MANQALVSIIIPTKDRCHLLQEALDSVRAQNFERWECLVVDDGSVDDTEQMVSRYANEDPRIRFIQRLGDPCGANACRNLGFQQSRGDFLIFLDSDDLLAPPCLARRVEVMQRNQDLDFAVFQARAFTEQVDSSARLWHPMTVGDDLSRFLEHECVWQTTGPIWRRTSLTKFGLFDEALLSMQDFDLHVRVLCQAPRYLKFSEVDHFIRGHEFDAKTSARHYTDPQFLLRVAHLPLRWHRDLLDSGLLTWSRKRKLVGLIFLNALNWVKIGQLTKGLEVWRDVQSYQWLGWVIYAQGILLLCLMGLSPKEGGLVYRLTGKWMGWVRFRQELNVIHS